VDVHIVEAVIKTGLDDLLAFAQLCLRGKALGRSPFSPFLLAENGVK